MEIKITERIKQLESNLTALDVINKYISSRDSSYEPDELDKLLRSDEAKYESTLRTLACRQIDENEQRLNGSKQGSANYRDSQLTANEEFRLIGMNTSLKSEFAKLDKYDPLGSLDYKGSVALRTKAAALRANGAAWFILFSYFLLKSNRIIFFIRDPL